MAKDLKDGGRFPKRLSLQCLSLLVGNVGGRFRTQLQPCRWKRIKLWGRYLFFSFLVWFGLPASFRLSYIEGKQWGRWLLIFLTKCGCWSSQTDETVAFFSEKNINFPSRPIKPLARQEVQPPCFLLICTQTPANWHLKLPIKWYGSICFISLVKKVQFHLSRRSYRKFHSNGKRSLKYGSQSIQTSLILRQRPPKSYELLEFFISFVTTVGSRHALTIWIERSWDENRSHVCPF